MTKRMLIALGLLSLAALGVETQAQTTMVGTITMVRTGWNDDGMGVVTAESMPNPARCPSTPGYVSTVQLPGYKTYLATALTAFAVRRKVHLIVHNTECVGGWPKLIGINLTYD
jgi:hypothetical protein